MKLTDSEAKMLREQCMSRRLIWYKNPPIEPDPRVMDLATKLLLAAKEKAAQMCKQHDACWRDNGGLDCHAADAEAIRSSDWGDLFEEK